VSALLTNSRAGAARLDNSSASPDALTSANSANSTSLTTDNSVTNPANPANTASIPELTNSSALKEFGRNEVDFYERMVAIDLKSLGQNHPTVADDLTALASIYVSQHRYSDAKPLLKRALSIYDNVYGPNNLLVTRTRTALVQVSRQIEHPELVASVYTDPSALANIPSSAKNLEISFKLNDLAFLCYCQGKIDNAINIYHWALAATAGATGKQSTLSAACMTDFATALRSTSDASESQKMMDSASGILTNSESAKNSRLY
jgi:tetratricopeptide (TPR) repeat protein